MAEDFQSKTEAPTQRRREEARQQGKVPISQDLSGGLSLAAATLGLMVAAAPLGAGLLEAVRHGLASASLTELGPEQVRPLLGDVLVRGLYLIGPWLGVVFVATLAGLVAQAGFHVLPELLGPRWEKLDFAEGFQRLFSLNSLARGGLAAAKLAVMSALVWVALKGRAPQLACLDQHSLRDAAVAVWEISLRLSLAMAAAFVVLGIVDYGMQRFRFEQSLRMTRQELKEELKREEGDPQVKARIRRMAREMSRRRMLREVPRATLVVTNPTHLAIALRYERGSQGAPRVVAKGAGHLARRIAELARRHGVPVVERKPIAQALYRVVQVGQEIPAALYQGVAEVIAYVYRLRGVA